MQFNILSGKQYHMKIYNILQGFKSFEESYQPVANKHLNQHILQETIKLIEVNWFGKYITQLLFLFFEIASYGLSFLFLIIGLGLSMWFGSEVNELKEIVDFIQDDDSSVEKVIGLMNLAVGIVYFLSVLPCFFMFWIARLCSINRKRRSKMILVTQNLIKVMANIKQEI